jgi:NADPH-dependent 2,4-dienoyl-CoA reductase/sulfur reductase-like enzyme
VGGSDAGVLAGLRAREVDPGAEVTLVVADAYPNFSICGIPYYISGDVADWRNLAHRSIADLETAGLHLRLNSHADSIDPVARTVTVTDADGRRECMSYEELIIGTGAVPVRPPIAGLDQLGPAEGVHLLRTMGDTLTLAESLTRAPSSALIIGAGYIGLEMAEALSAWGLTVTVVEQLSQVLGTVDANLADLVEEELDAHDVRVVTGTKIDSVEPAPKGLTVHGAHNNGDPFTATADLVLVVVGVRPDTSLATTAGARLSARSSIWVDRHMRTTVPHIYAAGDCVHTYHRVLDTDTYLPLGSTAHKQGRVAGENAAGGERRFAGAVGTQVVKVFDLVATRTGLREQEARQAGFEAISCRSVLDDHKAYYPGAMPIHVTVTGDACTGRLLGAQMIGHRGTAVAKRIDIYATALHHGMTVDAVSDLDLSYTPPLGSPYDAVQAAAHAWTLAHHSHPGATS